MTAPAGPPPETAGPLTEAQHDEVVSLIRLSLAQVLQLQARGQIVPPAAYTQGTVTSSDPADGSVVVALDIDTISGAVSPATVVGITPVVGARVACVLVNHTMYALGTLGPAQLLLSPTQDVSLASDGHPFQIGLTDSLNVAFDENEIQARNNGAKARLTLNNQGGDLQVGGVLLIGVPTGGSASTAYVGSTGSGLFTAVSYGQAFTADGRVILNAVGSGNYVDLRALDASVMARFSTNATPNTVLTFPIGLPSLSGTPVVITAGWQLAKQSSASLYKRDIAPLERAERDRLADIALGLEVVRWRYKLPEDGIIDRQAAERFSVGFRAEQVYDLQPEAVHLGPHPDEPPQPYEDGWEPPDDEPDAPHPQHRTRLPWTLERATLDPVPDSLDPFALIADLAALCHRQQEEIADLASRLDAVERG